MSLLHNDLVSFKMLDVRPLHRQQSGKLTFLISQLDVKEEKLGTFVPIGTKSESRRCPAQTVAFCHKSRNHPSVSHIPTPLL